MIKFSLAAQKLAHISPTADFDSSVKYGLGQREEKGGEGSSRGKSERSYANRWYYSCCFGYLLFITTLKGPDISSPSLLYKGRVSLSCSSKYCPGPWRGAPYLLWDVSGWLLAFERYRRRGSEITQLSSLRRPDREQVTIRGSPPCSDARLCWSFKACQFYT